VTSAASAGCHRLIREFGAVCVTSAEEMAELFPLAPQEASEPGGAGETDGSPGSGPSSNELRVRDAMSTRSAQRVDDIAARSGLSVAAVQAVLGTMQLAGSATERLDGWVRANGR
jgi:DNA processing protein